MRLITLISVAAILTGTTAFAESHGAGYLAGELLSPCQEADNDARWGETAELMFDMKKVVFFDPDTEQRITG